jgi:hypothetical protein
MRLTTLAAAPPRQAAPTPYPRQNPKLRETIVCALSAGERIGL